MTSTEDIAALILDLRISRVIFDLDGVCSNWSKAVGDLHGYAGLQRSYSQRPATALGISTNKMWRNIVAAGEAFWANMEPLPRGVALWHHLVEAGMPTMVCTAPSLNAASLAGKHAWIQKHLRIRPRKHQHQFAITGMKWMLAAPGRLLLDDTHRHVQEFRTPPDGSAGGFAALWPNSFDNPTAKGIH